MNLPQRVTEFELAKLWNVTERRVRQHKEAKHITRGVDGKYDLQECLAYRAMAMTEHQARMLFQTYHTKAGIHPPKILEHLADATDVTDEECLGLTPSLEPTTPSTATAAAQVATGYAKLQDVRYRKEELALERQARRDMIEAGRLIERDSVFKTSQEAAADIRAMLDSLCYEVGAMFPDPELRKEVRDKVQRLVDRTIFALHKKFDNLARPLDGPADDV